VNTDELISHYRNKRRTIIAFSVVVLGLLLAFKNTSYLIRSLSTAGLLIFFYLTDHLFNLQFKKKHYLFITLIAVTAFLFSPLYLIYPQYDKIQHFFLPILFASIVFHMVRRLNIEFKWQMVFVFFVVIGVIGLHEIGEYVLDVFFDLRLQGVFLRDLQGLEKYDLLLDRIDDTMMDMFLGVLGSATYVFSRTWLRKIKK